jgi:hypothetical protein
VNTIEKRGSDSLKNGALIGMAVGGGLAALGMAASGVSSEDAGLFVVGALIYTGIGALRPVRCSGSPHRRDPTSRS